MQLYARWRVTSLKHVSKDFLEGCIWPYRDKMVKSWCSIGRNGAVDHMPVLSILELLRPAEKHVFAQLRSSCLDAFIQQDCRLDGLLGYVVALRGFVRVEVGYTGCVIIHALTHLS